MRNAVASVVCICALVYSVNAEEAPKRESAVGTYSISLPAEWKGVDPKPKTTVVVAKRLDKSGNAEADIGEIMISELKGSIVKESGEMESSAKQNPGVIKLLEADEFKTQGGIVGRKVLMAVAARDPNYGSPLVFYSIYLPQADGTSVTFKLRCGRDRLDTLRKEFESIVAEAKKSR